MPLTPLERLGWTPALADALAAAPGAPLVPGRVSLEHNHVYRVLTEDGEWLAESAGRLKHRALGRQELPVVGDWVGLRRPDVQGQRAQIRAILPRRSWVSRKAAGREGRETEEQVLAANVDAILLVFGLDKPVNRRAIERYLVVARQSGARPLVVLNKADLAADLPAAVADATAVAGDAAVVALSAVDGRGMPVLEAQLAPGRTLALLGPSGAGKSTIVNRLIGQQLLPTGDVRPWDSRGRHTSVHRQLVVREAGGLVIDTPGMRELQLWESPVEDAFVEIAELGASCRFRDCRHDREPGCAVKAAIDAGLLDRDRYDSFLKLQAERVETTRKRVERAQGDSREGGSRAARGPLKRAPRQDD